MPKQVYHIKAFEGGINKKADPRDIEDNQLVEVTNASVSNVGRITMSGDGKSSFVTVNADNVPVSPTDSEGQDRFGNETPISSGHGLFSFVHDYNFDNTSVVDNTGPNEVNTEFICVNDGADIDVWTDIEGNEHPHWKDELISMGTVHNTGTQGDSEDLVDIKGVKPVYYKVGNGLRVCDANFGEFNSDVDTTEVADDETGSEPAKTEITVTANLGTSFTVGEHIRINNEIMLITNTAASEITVIRGRYGSKIESHASGSDIYKINVPKILSHIKRPMLKKAGANTDINRWIEDIQVPEKPKYGALTVFKSNIIGYDGTNVLSDSLYPSSPEKVNLGISLNTVETDSELRFHTGDTVTADTTSTETIVTITLASKATPETEVDVTSPTYNFAIGKFISIDGAGEDDSNGAVLNGVFEIVGFGAGTGEVKIAADGDSVGYTQTGKEIVILEDELIDDNLKNRYIFGMSYLYDGGGSELQESNITVGLSSGANLISPDNTFVKVSNTLPNWQTAIGSSDDIAIGSELIASDAADNRTFDNDEGNWAIYDDSGSDVVIAEASNRLQVTTTTDDEKEGAQLPIIHVGDGSTTSIVANRTYQVSMDLDLTTPGTGTFSMRMGLGGTVTSAFDITTTETTYKQYIHTTNNTGALLIYNDSSTASVFTIDNVSVKLVSQDLSTSSVNSFIYKGPGAVDSNSNRNWIFYEAGTNVVEQETEYYISGALTYTNKGEATEDIRVYVGVGPGQPDVSAGSPAPVPVTVQAPSSSFTGLIEFAGIAVSGSSIDYSVPVAIQVRNAAGGGDPLEKVTLNSISVTKKNTYLQIMSHTNSFDFRQVKDVAKGYLSFLCNNSRTGIFNSTTANNSWNERIEGFRIYMKQVDIIGGGLADEWTMLYDVDLKEGTYVMHAKDSNEEILRLGDIDDNQWSATDTTSDADQKALVTTNVKGDSIKTPPLITYEANNGYKSDTNLAVRYKCATTVDRKVYIGNLKIGDKTFPDRMLRSDTDKFDTFPDDGTHFIDVATSDGESIVALESIGNKLIQYKEKTTYLIKVTSEGEELVTTWSGAGIKNPCQVAKSNEGIFWVNSNGIYYYDGQKLSNVSSDKFRIDNWLTNEDFKRPVIVGYDKYSNKLIILITNISGASSSGYIYDITNSAITQHDNIFNWYQLSNPGDAIFGNSESEV